MRTSFSTYSGPDFLLFYLALFAMAVLASWWIAQALRPDGRDQKVSDPLDLAVLAGGPGRFTEAVLARLLGIGAIEPAGGTRMRVRMTEAGETMAERKLLRSQGEFGLSAAHATLVDHARDIEQRLIDRELLLDRGQRMRLRLLSIAPFAILLAIGLYRHAAGVAEGESVGLLTMLLLATTIAGAWRFFRYDRRTKAGQEAIDAARERSRRLERAPTQAELGLGVALFGTAILASTPFSQLHAMRQSATTDSGGGYTGDGGGSDGSSDGGGSGCGGGGCGGCGG